jgi:hypothetical protein
MSPTLADAYMITGLDISGSVYLWDYKGSTRKTGVKPGSGYKSYIQSHMKDDPLSEVEYRAFLNMWLRRFIFCGKANEPTLNHIAMATQLAAGKRIPLGKYLLGSAYHMLHQTISQMHTGRRYSVSTAFGGLCRCGCNCTCTGLSTSTSTIGFSPHPATKKGKLRLPEDVKPMEKLHQPFPLIKMSVSFSSFSSKASLILFGSLI